MSNIIYKPHYATSQGHRLSSSNGIWDYLRLKCQSIKQPSVESIKHKPLPQKSECPGICVGTLYPKYDSTDCYIVAKSFQSTDTLLLDIDELNNSVDNITNWIESIIPKDVQYLWYTTPRHTATQPRIRLVLRLNREISASEKHDLQFRLNIPGVDKASFQLNKFCLLPVWCSDTTEFNWGEGGSRLLDVDVDLKTVNKLSYKLPKRRLVNYINSSNTCRLSADEISNLIEEINDAPNGRSRELMMPRLSSLFRRFDSYEVYMQCMDHLEDIDRYDRQHDFKGLIEWFYEA